MLVHSLFLSDVSFVPVILKSHQKRITEEAAIKKKKQKTKQKKPCPPLSTIGTEDSKTEITYEGAIQSIYTRFSRMLTMDSMTYDLYWFRPLRWVIALLKFNQT